METNEDPPRLVLKDALLTLPPRDVGARYSTAHFHPAVNELVIANDNDIDPPRPDWIAATVTSRPNGQLATYHETKATFTAFSRKTRRLVSEESYWERLYRVMWNLDPDVGDFEMQGLEIDMLRENGQESFYTLDAVIGRGSKIEAKEIKASGSHLLERETRQLMANAHDILARASILFMPITGNALLENRRLLMNLSYGHIHKDDAVPQEERESVVEAIAGGASTFAELLPIIGSCPLISKAKAFSLLASGALWFDLSKELRAESLVRAPLRASHANIRTISRRFVR